MKVFFDEINKRYFTGYSGLGVLVIDSCKRLLIPEMEKGKVKGEVCKDVFGRLKEIVGKKKVGVDYSKTTLSDVKGFKTYDISRWVNGLRAVKKKDEIEKLRKGCHIASHILNTCFQVFGRFRSESEVSGFLEFKAKKKGCEVSFKPIVASGKGSALPHYDGSGKLKKGFCVVDFGVKYEGYCSDMTRMVYIGKPAAKEIEDYKQLLDIQKEAISKVKVGLKCADLAKWVSGKVKMIHGLGHGVGLEIHESPTINTKSKDVFKKGMVFAIEPGKYEKYGIRIEDTILLGDKVEVLTKMSKRLKVI